METLLETVVRECGKCDAVALAWVAGETAFAVQTKVTIKRTLKKGDDGEWTYVEPVYATSAQRRQAEEAVSKIRELHPEAYQTLVNYAYRPGGAFVEVFRR